MVYAREFLPYRWIDHGIRSWMSPVHVEKAWHTPMNFFRTGGKTMVYAREFLPYRWIDHAARVCLPYMWIKHGIRL